MPTGNPDGSGRNRAYFGYGPNGPGFGSSFWSYADARDARRKAEGSYKPFTGANGWNKDGSARGDNLGTYSETQTAHRQIGVLSDPGAPVWTLPYVSGIETATVSLGDQNLRSITAEDSSTPFLAYARPTAGGMVLSVGDRSTDTTDAFSRPFFTAYSGAAVMATYTGPAPGPHGDYNGVGDKCRICHAVHRAGGARSLGRNDTREEACSYCHRGEHRHASLETAEETAAAGHGIDTIPENGWTATGHGDIPY